jgi:hypothetical protein
MTYNDAFENTRLRNTNATSLENSYAYEADQDLGRRNENINSMEGMVSDLLLDAY